LKRNTYTTCTHNNTIYFSFASLSHSINHLFIHGPHSSPYTHHLSLCSSSLRCKVTLVSSFVFVFFSLVLCSFVLCSHSLCSLIHSLTHSLTHSLAHAHSFVPWRLLFLLPLMLTTAFHDSVHPSRATLIYYSCFAFLVLSFLCESNRIKMSEGQYMQETSSSSSSERDGNVEPVPMRWLPCSMVGSNAIDE